MASTKAILVIDMPKDCEDCRLSYSDSEKLYCSVQDKPVFAWVLEDEYTPFLDEGCPLKEMPRKRAPFDICDYYALGWNCCVNEILGSDET